MSPTSYRCTCGAEIRFKQDLERGPGTVVPSWLCRDCGTPVPGTIAEKIRHQHPS